MADTIIVQETDASVLDILTYALEGEGFNVFPLLDCGEDFLELIEEVRPHVIMLDYKLNGKRSIEICHLIKARFPHLPVLALSCNNNINDVFDRFGFDGYIKKPFDLDLLYKVLRTHIPKQLAAIL
jgi:DNA-binding response OmpR family regulator